MKKYSAKHLTKLLSFLSISLFLASQSTAATYARQYKFPSQPKMIQLSLSPGMESSLDLHLAVDTSASPMKMSGKYQSLKADGDISRSCSFSSKLTAAESQQIKSALEKVRYCQAQGNEDMVIDPEYLESLYVYTQKPAAGRDARGADIKKYSLVGWGPQKYLCKGGKEFYSLMKSISAKRTPKSCPAKSAKLFNYRPELNH